MSILDNLRQIRYRVAAAAQKARRDPSSVRLVAVTKYAALEQVREILESGEVAEIAESRVQDAQAKKRALGGLANRARWRMIGHLQTNKAKIALETFDAVDSLDSLRLAQALEKPLAAQGRKLPVLLQVKLSDKETQGGLAADAVESLLEALKSCPHLEPNGLMGIAPMLEPVEEVRPHFKGLRALFEKLFSGRPGAQLSMGMSRDFEIAIEEGATMIRLGTSIFPETMHPREGSHDR